MGWLFTNKEKLTLQQELTDTDEDFNLAFEVAKNPIARVSILARFSGPSPKMMRTPGLNIKLGLSFSRVRRRQRNVPEDRRGEGSSGGPGIYRAKRPTNSPAFQSAKANVPNHQLRLPGRWVIVQIGEGFGIDIYNGGA